MSFSQKEDETVDLFVPGAVLARELPGNLWDSYGYDGSPAGCLEIDSVCTVLATWQSPSGRRVATRRRVAPRPASRQSAGLGRSSRLGLVDDRQVLEATAVKKKTLVAVVLLCAAGVSFLLFGCFRWTPTPIPCDPWHGPCSGSR